MTTRRSFLTALAALLAAPLLAPLFPRRHRVRVDRRVPPFVVFRITNARDETVYEYVTADPRRLARARLSVQTLADARRIVARAHIDPAALQGVSPAWATFEVAP